MWSKQDQCKMILKQYINNCISKLLKEQQELVTTNIGSAKHKSAL